MGGLPVPINGNLDRAVNQLPIAGDTGVEGRLGGIKADGTTILVDQTTGVASVSGGGGGAISGLTAGFIPLAGGPDSITGDSALDQGVTGADTITASLPISINVEQDSGSTDLTAFAVYGTVDDTATPSQLFGVYIGVENDAPITLDGVQVLQVDNLYLSDGTVTNLNCLTINGWDNGGGIVNTVIGLLIGPGVSNGSLANYAILSQSTAQSIFSGKISTPTMNVSVSADPASPVDGDIWYNSTTHLLKARINGATVTISHS